MGIRLALLQTRQRPQKITHGNVKSVNAIEGRTLLQVCLEPPIHGLYVAPGPQTQLVEKIRESRDGFTTTVMDTVVNEAADSVFANLIRRGCILAQLLLLSPCAQRRLNSGQARAVSPDV